MSAYHILLPLGRPNESRCLGIHIVELHQIMIVKGTGNFVGDQPRHAKRKGKRAAILQPIEDAALILCTVYCKPVGDQVGYELRQITNIKQAHVEAATVDLTLDEVARTDPSECFVTVRAGLMWCS